MGTMISRAEVMLQACIRGTIGSLVALFGQAMLTAMQSDNGYMDELASADWWLAIVGGALLAGLRLAVPQPTDRPDTYRQGLARQR